MAKNTLLILLILFIDSAAFAQATKLPVIVCSKHAKGAELLAAKELQRYLYLRTGRLPIVSPWEDQKTVPKPSIVVASWPTIASTVLAKEIALAAAPVGEGYVLKSVNAHQLWIVGGSEVATLYGA